MVPRLFNASLKTRGNIDRPLQMSARAFDVAACFGRDLPVGLTICKTPADYIEAMSSRTGAGSDETKIRAAVCQRFSWEANLQTLLAAIEQLRTGNLS